MHINKKHKIGIGLITWNRENYYEKVLDSIPTNIVDEFIVVKDGGGEPYTKKPQSGEYIEFLGNEGNTRSKSLVWNYLLSKGCKHIFLIEDDIEILDENVFEAYIEAACKSGIWHLNFEKVELTCGGGKSDIIKTIDYPNGCKIDFHQHLQGGFMYALDTVIKHVGDWDYGFKNAYTHVEWSYRVAKNNLWPGFWWFPDVHGSDKLLRQIPGSGHNSSITNKDKYNIYQEMGVKRFTEKYGYFVNAIPRPSEQEIEQSARDLYIKYNKENGL